VLQLLNKALFRYAFPGIFVKTLFSALLLNNPVCSAQA